MRKLKVQISEGAFLLLVLGETAIIQLDGEVAVVELALDDVGLEKIARHITMGATHPNSPIKQ